MKEKTQTNTFDDALLQALEFNGIEKEKAEEIVLDFYFLLTAEELIKKAEKKTGKTVEDMEERRELRRILANQLKAEAEMIAYRFLKKEGLL